MGAWSETSFGNDDALDFIYEVESSGQTAIENSIKSVISLADTDFLEAPEACCALAAAEFIAAKNGHPASDFPEQAKALLPQIKHSEPLKSEAVSACKRILANSELRELWDETETFDAWSADVNNLIGRLG